MRREVKIMQIASALSRRQALTGTATALVAAPFVIRSGFAQRRTIDIGVIEPLSGANAQFGVISRDGMEFVADEISAAGGIKALGGAQINLIVADATSNPTKAAIAAQSLITQNDLTAVIGAFASSLTLAVSEVTARADIPMLTASFADEITGRGLESVFKLVATATVIGRAQINYTLAIAEAAGSKINKIAIMYEDTAYGTAQSRGLRKAARDSNIEVVMDEAYPFGITDATPLVSKLPGFRRASSLPGLLLQRQPLYHPDDEAAAHPDSGNRRGGRLRHSRLRKGAWRIRRGGILDQYLKLRSRPRVDGPIPQALRLLHGTQRDRSCGRPRRARTSDRAGEVGKAASGNRSPARRAV